ncbi:hypothetical protein COU76_04070 [Candidatus Peregrinibacteria bacterium CG10_big_fil_rev_8_21_14_0_10_49_10]|nr:MAG: hypothetical protein COU76_04070 [Candidatus Peregrinibacteria bacterium CG10_big_fil_rev_8_21_14_0_10_49_10]
MSQTHKPRRQSVPAATILHRSAVPLFLFALVLLLFLLCAYLFLIPRLTTVEIGGEERSTRELRAYHDALLIDLSEKEHERDALVLPMGDTAYSRLVEEKHAEFPLLVLRSSLEQTVRQLFPADQNTIYLESIRYLPNEKSVELAGDVRHVGSRSMTVLAQLLEELRSLPFVSQITNPRFVREEDPAIGPHSPFTLRMLLQS